MNLNDDQIRRLHNGFRDGTAHDAIGRHLCRVALKERCIGDDSIPDGLRYPTPDEVDEARRRLADHIKRGLRFLKAT